MRWVIAAIVLLGWGCAFDFDGYDPRLALTGGASSGGASSGGASSGGASSGGASSGGSSSGGAGGDPATTSAGGSAQGGGGAEPMVLEIVAVVAECVDLDAPDPDACAASQPPATMGVDGETTTGMMNPRHSYLRFDLAALAGAQQIVSAVLELTVAQVTSAESRSSGEIWQVEPFTRSDLFVATPAPVGNEAIAGDQGAVSQGETVAFDLPTSLVAEPSLFLGVLPLITNGIDYDNLDGAVPPRLRVTVE